MSNIRRTLMLAIWLTAASTALAKPVAGQGRACSAQNKCDPGLQCVARREGKSTCEVVCQGNAKCPEDQRCVKDGSMMVCRPIIDL
jgi:hypothetical protein